MNTATTAVTQVDRTFYYILGFSFILLFLITVAMVYFLIRYRRSRNPEPEDIRGNVFLEIVWTVIPTVIALSMFYVGWSSYMHLRNVPPDALQINVYAQMWSWIFLYPNDKEVEGELVVPLGRPVKLNVKSEDVIHSLFIPAFRVKIDAVPGMQTYAWFLPDKEGEYLLLCAEYCGPGHSHMTAKVRVVPEAEYRAWLEKEPDE